MEFSNNSLAVFLLIAVVISVGGTMISLNKLNTLSKITTTTGLATANSTGITLLNISSLTSIRFAINTVDFGVGSVNTTGSFNNCTMTINGSSTITRVGCIGFNANNPNGAVDSFILENNGNTNLNVTLNVSDNATGFIGGNLSIVSFKYAMSENETPSCQLHLSNTDWTEFVTTDTNICENLTFQTSTNSLRIGIKIVIPDNAPSGYKTATLSATGIAY